MRQGVSGEQCGRVSRFLAHKALKKMNKKIFIENVYMDTQTAYMANGDINIYPCAWEADKAPVTADGTASFKGRICVEEDGRATSRCSRPTTAR